MANKNYGRIYELTLPNPKKLDLAQVIQAFKNAHTSGEPYETSNGVLYVKDLKEMNDSYIVLFGKDNEDSSNYKRNKSTGKKFDKINIDESKEVLADFIHVGISKTKRLAGYTVVTEKNRLFRFGSLFNLFNYTLSGAANFDLGRRVVSDYIEEIHKARRVLEIKQIEYDPQMPNLPGYHNEDMNTFTVQRTFEVKATPRGSIGQKLLDKIVPTFNTKKGLKTIVTIVNKTGVRVSMDFDEPEAETGLLVELPPNYKTEKVQSMIAVSMNDIISKDNQGKL